MSFKRFCDYCVREIIPESRYTTMTIVTMDADGTRQAPAVFEFHGSCYNTLQGMITTLRDTHPVEPIDPKPDAPPDQPVDPNDPTPPSPEPTPPA